jgi:CheY-like chemotaxis protein
MTDGQVSLRDTLGPHLPYLRRYARALTGSQKRGDSFVRAALEALVEQPDLIDEHLGTPRLALFRLFHAFYGPHRDALARPAGADEGLPMTGREALLLTAIEGFDLAETAIVLGRAPDAVAAELDAAREAIAGTVRSRVLVIEDEPIISMHIEQIVTDMGHEVVATAVTRDEAVAAARRVKPELVLADIQLADGSSGLDAVRDILTDHAVPVIFITAYPERLLTGERPEPTYLVTKPFEPATVVATIGQALLTRARQAAAEAAG